MILAFEDSAYLEALHGGHTITKSIAAQVAEVEARLAAVDDFATPEAEYRYSPTTGELTVIRDDGEVEHYDIPKPTSGYWSNSGYDSRRVGQYAVIPLTHNPSSDRLTAEGMFDWPIYQAGIRAMYGEALFIEGWTRRGDNDAANTAFAKSVTDIWNANLQPMAWVTPTLTKEAIRAAALENGEWPCGHAERLDLDECCICAVVDPRDAEVIDDRPASERYGSPEHEAWLIEMEQREG